MRRGTLPVIVILITPGIVLMSKFALADFIEADSPAISSRSNFSQYPGFIEHFDAFPRRDHRLSAAERALLERHRPRLFVAEGEEGPISFYADYIAQGTLYDARGAVIGRAVDRRLLNIHKQDPQVTFVHERRAEPARPVVFGRVDRTDVPGVGGFTFLTYHFVFRYSGVPAGIPSVVRSWLDLIADATDWHQLDHYTMTSVVLDGGDRPVAIMLQQHNYLRTYLLGRDMFLPEDGRPLVDAAIGSNELYPHRASRAHHRAVSFMSPQTLPYLVTGEARPFLAGDDITDPEREVEYQLEWLPHSDAFYSFQGYLGERRWLPGRSGPPGADYNTLPRFKPLAVQLVAFNWRDHDREQMADLLNFLGDPPRRRHAFAALVARFRSAMAVLRTRRDQCCVE